MKKETTQRKQNCLLLIVAAVAVIAVAAVFLIPNLSGSSNPAPSEPQSLESQPQGTTSPENVPPAGSSDLVIQVSQISAEASYFDYDADGTTVQVFAVLASDGTIRLALNTCQVCNGSPYAYFEQDGDYFVCQNCKNRFASIQIGLSSGGCNPVPIPETNYIMQDDSIIISADYLDASAFRFANWKKF